MKRNRKKGVSIFAASILMGAYFLTGCGKTDAPASAQNEPEETTTKSSQETSTEEHSMAQEDFTDNGSSTGHKAILVVSFGTSYNDSRDITIGAIENAIEKAFPDFEVRRGFTSQIIIDKLKERDGLEIDNVEEALDRAVADGIKTLVVQPTHLMSGYEYTDLADALKDYAGKFDQLVLGEPLLSSDEDYKAVEKAITDATASYDDGETAICFMGHGTEAASNSDYAKLQKVLTADGYENYFVGTVEAEPSLDDLIKAVKAAGKYKKVILQPLMVVAGDHANNDMAGDDEDSWKSGFEAEGYEVECLLHGLGENKAIQDIYTAHTQAAIDSLTQ